MMINFKKGFSVIELLVVLAILILLALIVLPSFRTMRHNQILKTTVAEVISAINQAKSQSLASIDSLEYGVHFAAGQVTVFKGSAYTYDGNDSNQDIVFSGLATLSNINLNGGGVDIYFDRLTGMPNTSGTVTVTVSSLSRVITISATGSASMN